MSKHWLSLAVPALVLLTGACATAGLGFRVDDRVDIVAPGERDEVELPLTIRWEAHDIEGTFGVFVDRSPQPPGKSLSWFSDDECDAQPGCPDAAYLAQRDIYTTNEHSLTIERVVEPVEKKRCHMHEATIVLLDADGRRKGESAWSVEFRLCDDRR